MTEGHTHGKKVREWVKWVRLATWLFWPVMWTIWFVGGLIHWWLFIKNTPEKYLPERVVVPDDLKGRWAHGLFDCCQTPGMCIYAACCPHAAISDMWYRAGWAHAALDMKTDPYPGCPGWQYFAAMGGYCAMMDVCGIFESCMNAMLRGGIRMIDEKESGLGDIVDHRTRFELPHTGWGTFYYDCCAWCWCLPCAYTQEYRQIMELLARPLEVAAPVGEPVQVVGRALPPQEQADPTTENNKSSSHVPL